jgi:hypothetical protein
MIGSGSFRQRGWCGRRVSTSNHLIPLRNQSFTSKRYNQSGGRSSCDSKPLQEYPRFWILPVHPDSLHVRSQGESGKMYTDASGPAINFSNRTNLFRSHHHPVCHTLFEWRARCRAAGARIRSSLGSKLPSQKVCVSVIISYRPY